MRLELEPNFDRYFYVQINREIRKKISQSIPKIQNNINEKIKNLVLRNLNANIEEITGRTYHEIGVPDINQRMQSVIRTISNNSYAKVRAGGGTNILLKIDIGILKDDYSDILTLPEAAYQYSGFKNSGILTWLEWLVTAGTNPIVSNYYYADKLSKNSRTNRGIMINSNRSWSVPSDVAGTPDNNIFTRALEKVSKDIEVIVQAELLRVFK